MEDDFYLNQCYRRVGDHIEMIMAEQDQCIAGFAPGMPRNFVTTLALVTLFQFTEGYTDKQAAEAARMRADWKYALNLPLSYPGFDPIWLCRLREYAFRSESGTASLQALAKRLAEYGLLSPKMFESNHGKAPPADEILQSICQYNRLVQITEAMLLAVEALTAQEGVRLPALCLSQLYETYAKTFRILRKIRTSEEAVGLAGKIATEVASLLGLVEAYGEIDWSEMPEITHLCKVWEGQYHRQEAGEPDEPVWIWRPVDCYHCNLEARGELTS